ncbi:hypothetical protein ABPG72_018257 [Tetrahymena utriculariae]
MIFIVLQINSKDQNIFDQQEDVIDTQEVFFLKNQESTTSQIEYKEYSQRFATLIGYILVMASYFFSINTFNIISANVSDIYNVKPIVVNLNSLMQNILFLPVTLPVGYILEKYGLCVSIYISSILVIVGVWLRVLINQNYYLVFLGHILMGLGIPFIQNMMTKLSLVWFRAEKRKILFLFFYIKRQIITQILMITTMITMLISSLLPGMWMKDYDEIKDEQDDYKEGRNKVKDLMMIQAIVSSALAVIGCLLFKEKPLTPPSFTATQQRDDVKSSIKKLIKSKNYIIIFVCYGLFCGNFYTFGVTTSYLFKPYGFGSDVVSYSGICIVLFGVLGAGIGGKLFKAKPKFKLFIIIGILGSMVGLGLTLAFFPIQNSILIMFPYITIGLTSMQAFPIFLELASEIVYPVSESVSSGFLLGSSNLVGFALGSVYSLMLNDDSKSMVIIVQICGIVAFAVCILLIKFLKAELNRTKVDAQHEQGIRIVEQNNEDENIFNLS